MVLFIKTGSAHLKVALWRFSGPFFGTYIFGSKAQPFTLFDWVFKKYYTQTDLYKSTSQ
jgi:hypothetical protein